MVHYLFISLSIRCLLSYGQIRNHNSSTGTNLLLYGTSMSNMMLKSFFIIFSRRKDSGGGMEKPHQKLYQRLIQSKGKFLMMDPYANQITGRLSMNLLAWITN